MSEQTLSKPAHRPASVPIKRIALGAIAGSERYLLVHEFGSQDAPLHIYMQAGLHADEAPGSVVLYQLADQLAQLESEGQVQARITLLPAANPIGATQYLTGGLHCGRFDLATGINFNRRFPDLRPAVREALAANPKEFDPRHFLKPSIKYMQKVCSDRYQQFGSAGNAGKIKQISLEDFAAKYAKGELNAVTKAIAKV